MTSDQPWWLTMPPAELAARILPLFSASNLGTGKRPIPYIEEGEAVPAIAKWCRTGEYDKLIFAKSSAEKQFTNPDYRAVTEAIRVLEQAGLVMTTGAERRAVGLTRLGEHALQTNTVRQHLGLGDAAPTA